MGPRKREALEGYLYLTPWALGFLIFVAGPMLASLYLSFTKYNVMLAPEWVGLGNYITALDYGTDGENYHHWWTNSDERTHVIARASPASTRSTGRPC